jgi:DmsE family decaheme c-type cytochrome
MLRKVSLTKAPWLVKLLPLALILGACATGAIREKQLTLPTIEGAEAVGQETCLECHDDYAESFAASAHGRLAEFELMGAAGGCEACHGNGSLHVDDDDAGKILKFGELLPEESAAVCAKCHSDGGLMDWTHSQHALADVACSDCHSIHGGGKAALKQDDPDLCYSCHQEQMAQANFPSHHPIREGKMTCGDCHNPHGELNTHERTNDLCLDCHSRYQGPFVFGHAPVEDDCTICHNPHGSVANNLLAQNEPFLCLQCHEGHFHILRKGFDPASGNFNSAPDLTQGEMETLLTDSGLTGTIAVKGSHGATGVFDNVTDAKAFASYLNANTSGHRFFVNSDYEDYYTVWQRSTTSEDATTAANPHGAEGFQTSFGTKCTTCHQVVHGSDFPSQPLGGGGLTR